MRDEIQAGIKNAIERGASIEDAIQTFISAGYNPVEVREAANSVGKGASSYVNKPDSPPSTPAQPSQQTQSFKQDSSAVQRPSNIGQIPSGQPQPVQKMQPMQQNVSPFSQQPFNQMLQKKSLPESQPPTTNNKKKIVVLSILVILLLGAAAILYFFFKDDILKLLGMS